MCSARLYCNKRGAKINKYIEKYVDRRRPVLGEASGIRDAGRNINVGQSKSRGCLHSLYRFLPQETPHHHSSN